MQQVNPAATTDHVLYTNNGFELPLWAINLYVL
jgi:hypothetical protein